MAIVINGTGDSGGVSPRKALIHVNAMDGSTVSYIYNNVTAKTITPEKAHPNSDGVTSDYYFPVSPRSYGNWTITSSLNGDTKTTTRNVNSNAFYDIQMTGLYDFTLNRKFLGSDLTSSAPWVATNGTNNMTMVSGTWTVTDNKLVANGSTYFRTETPGTNVLYGIRCSVDSSFTPVSTSNWYSQSCLFGTEVSGIQKDYAATLVKSGNDIYPCIGYPQDAYAMADKPIPLDEDFDLFLLYTGTKYTMFLNGEVIKELNFTATGTAFTTVGVFYNNSGGGTAVKGTISAFGIWTFTNGTGTKIVLPSFDYD